MKGKQLMVEKQKQITVIRKQENTTLGNKQDHFDGRSYRLVKKEQKTVTLDAE